MAKEDLKRDEASGAELEGDAKLVLPNGETILLPYLKVIAAQLVLRLQSGNVMSRYWMVKLWNCAGLRRKPFCRHTKAVQRVRFPAIQCGYVKYPFSRWRREWILCRSQVCTFDPGFTSTGDENNVKYDLPHQLSTYSMKGKCFARAF